MEAALSRTDAQSDAQPSEISTAERCVAFCRGVVFTTTLLMMEGEVLAGMRELSPLDLLAFVAAVYVIGTSIWSMLGHEHRALQFPLLVADMLMITGIMLLAEGVRTEYYLLYYMPILQASIRLNFRDAVSSALLSSALYGLVALNSGTDIVVPMTTHLRAGTFAASAVFMAIFFALLSREAKVHLRRSQEMGELANALAAKNKELEERTRELAQAQESLLSSERLATIGELAASVGHELRNPLGVIRNAAYYLRMQVAEGNEDLKEMLDLIDSEISTCDRTIGALLDFARPEQATPQMIDINELVTKVAAKCSPADGITVDLDLSTDARQVLADPHQLEQVFNNIVSNAFQAMGSEGKLSVTTSLEGDGEGVLVAFQDTGPGIPQENLDKIFDPLFTTKAKGIGLGLVVCKRLVERQGGRLEVESASGEGATFKVHLLTSGGPDNGSATDGDAGGRRPRDTADGGADS